MKYCLLITIVFATTFPLHSAHNSKVIKKDNSNETSYELFKARDHILTAAKAFLMAEKKKNNPEFIHRTFKPLAYASRLTTGGLLLDPAYGTLISPWCTDLLFKDPNDASKRLSQEAAASFLKLLPANIVLKTLNPIMFHSYVAEFNNVNFPQPCDRIISGHLIPYYENLSIQSIAELRTRLFKERFNEQLALSNLSNAFIGKEKSPEYEHIVQKIKGELGDSPIIEEEEQKEDENEPAG